ncbi:hypothetical protein EZV61_09085 [Corallincola luteus]|uniref:Uncharacterized protein n=1 Tax=Corallincola luteus TaxID=1775177 RepID=A0ABY2AL88_9GAMM|nr:hypothetical protein [Corallincola luteus]TCI03688.1 hypothetical protein EZV61_09085 [Corallincola luteus]
MKLELVHCKRLSPELFEKHPVWAEYYEPDDEHRMVEDGFDRAEVQRELKRVKYSDDYLIPFINYDKPSPYEFTIYKASATVNDSKVLFATLFVMENTVNSVTIFVGNEQFVLNLTDSDFSEEKELCAALEVKSIFSLTVRSDKGIEFNERFESGA